MMEGLGTSLSPRRDADFYRIVDEVRSLAPGQRVTIPRHRLELSAQSYECAGATFNPADQIMEKIIGASYEYGYREEFMMRAITFYRLEEPLDVPDYPRTYVSPDRRQM